MTAGNGHDRRGHDRDVTTTRERGRHSRADLREEIIRLGPWLHEVRLKGGLSTRVAADVAYPEPAGPVRIMDPRPRVAALAEALREGLEGRSLLDCGCNCGGHTFAAKGFGAGRCFGFDVREHWIRQARFLLEHFDGPTDDVRFEVRNLYELPSLGLEPFDVTLFRGLFYHLPDPITGLRIAADLTRELLVLETEVRSDMPDGLLAVKRESTERLMSGVYGLSWFPTGPDVLARILEWAGFVETRLVHWRKGFRPGVDRLELVAAKRSGLLDGFPPPEVLEGSEASP